MNIFLPVLRLNILPTTSLAITTFTRRLIHTSSTLTAGHAKWQNIKHVKATNDALRAKMIAKQMRLIRLAVIEGGGSPNPQINSTLRNAIDEAVRRFVPQSTIQSGLKKLAKQPETSALRRHLFECRMYKKVYVIITIYTDNLALARIQLATPFKKHFVEITGTKGLFTERGIFNVTARSEIRADHFEDDCLADAIECDAEEIEVHDAAKRQVTFFCSPRDFVKVKQKLSAIGHQIEFSECIFIPQTPLITLNSAEAADYKHFKERLNAIDGMDEIYDNLEEDNEEDEGT